MVHRGIDQEGNVDCFSAEKVKGFFFRQRFLELISPCCFEIECVYEEDQFVHLQLSREANLLDEPSGFLRCPRIDFICRLLALVQKIKGLRFNLINPTENFSKGIPNGANLTDPETVGCRYNRFAIIIATFRAGCQVLQFRGPLVEFVKGIRFQNGKEFL
ncbi:hypothetical protein SLA2020_360480 [Shorea laevis]